MLHPRLIPVLLIKDGGLQKSRQFSSWKYVGDVLNAVKIFNEKDVDELVVLDVDASRHDQGPNFAVLEQLAAECFMPVAYGGGIASADLARRVMDCGIEKVVLNTAAWRRPELVSEVAAVLGSSSTVISVDMTSKWGGARRFDHLARRAVKSNVTLDLERLISAGAGEVLLQSKDSDGTLAGPDLPMIRAMTDRVNVPVVYAGGIRSIDDCVDVWSAGASGAAAGAWFVFRGPHRAVLITYPRYEVISEKYQRVRGSLDLSS